MSNRGPPFPFPMYPYYYPQPHHSFPPFMSQNQPGNQQNSTQNKHSHQPHFPMPPYGFPQFPMMYPPFPQNYYPHNEQQIPPKEPLIQNQPKFLKENPTPNIEAKKPATEKPPTSEKESVAIVIDSGSEGKKLKKNDGIAAKTR